MCSSHEFSSGDNFPNELCVCIVFMVMKFVYQISNFLRLPKRESLEHDKILHFTLIIIYR